MNRLAIVITHPIQYNAPWFRLLAERENLQLKVFYTWSQSSERVQDHTFGREIKWDIPLLDGYEYEFVENVSITPGTHNFKGIDCPSLISKIEEFNPNAILVFGWNFKSHFKVMRYFKGKIPVWFRGDSTLLDEGPGFKTQLRRFVLKFVYRYVDKVFYVGKANKAYFLAHGLKEKQLVYAPHAIDNHRFSSEANQEYDLKAKQWREEIGFKADEIVVLFAGKFEAKKQPDVLIRAVQEVNNKTSKTLKLLLIGSGPLEEELKNLIDGDKNIKILPFQNQSVMPIVYRLGDVLCLPSKGPGETWGLAVNEAMASGRSVIVSDKVGCSQDLLVIDKTGFVIKQKYQEELVKRLDSITLEELKRMGQFSSQFIKSWSFDAIINAFMKNTLEKI